MSKETAETGAKRINPYKRIKQERFLNEMEYKRKAKNRELLEWSLAGLFALIFVFGLAVLSNYLNAHNL